MPQIAYYVSAYADMVARGAVDAGEPLDVCVPTGNFGNILAAYYAKRMGVPLGRLLCASNANKVLADFIATGIYDIAERDLVKTPSPSMDILVSSNLERLLFDLCGNAALIRQWMKDLKKAGRFSVDVATRERLKAEFTGAWVDNDTCLQTIGRVQREHGYLLDPHTAVAWKVAEELGDARRPTLIVSTAHWSKFAADVVRGLRGVPAGAPIPGAGPDIGLLDVVTELAPGATVPPQLQAVRERPVRFEARVARGREAVEAGLRGWLDGSAL
jgi:threonine synthase